MDEKKVRINKRKIAIRCTALKAEGRKMKKVGERERERSARKQSVKGRREEDVGENKIRNHGDTERKKEK